MPKHWHLMPLETFRSLQDFYIPEYEDAKTDKNAFSQPQELPYPLTVTGKNNFTGEIPVTLTISKDRNQISMTDVIVKGITSQKWTGEQITQKGFTVSYQKDVLTAENGDYTITWGENKTAGTGTVTFTGTGQDTDGDGLSYIGSKTVYFKITGNPMNKVSVSSMGKSFPYTGNAIEPVTILRYQADKNSEPVLLTKDIHFTTTYERNVNKGTATIIFTGMESGGYTGVKKYQFKITPAGMDESSADPGIGQVHVTFKNEENIRDGIYVAPYMKGGSKPEVILTYGDKTLEAGKDYTLSYSNNKKSAASTDSHAPTLTIKGKGNFKGSRKITFTIEPKALKAENGIYMTVQDKVENGKPNGYRQGFQLYDADGKALTAADYDGKQAVYTLMERRDESGNTVSENQVLDSSSMVSAGSVIQITVQGKGNYAGGEITGSYRIITKEQNIQKSVIQIAPQSYTGEGVVITDQSRFVPGKVYLLVNGAKKELVLGKDLEVVPGSYVGNTKKGSAKVTFRGINEYGGFKTVSFKILPRSIKTFWKGNLSKEK